MQQQQVQQSTACSGHGAAGAAARRPPGTMVPPPFLISDPMQMSAPTCGGCGAASGAEESGDLGLASERRQAPTGIGTLPGPAARRRPSPLPNPKHGPLVRALTAGGSWVSVNSP